MVNSFIRIITFFMFLGLINPVKAQNKDIAISVSCISVDNAKINVLLLITSNSKKKQKIIKPNKTHSNISINYPWSIIIEKGDVKLCAPEVVLGYGMETIELSKNKSKSFIIEIDLNKLVDCNTEDKHLFQQELYGEFNIVFQYMYKGKIINSNILSVVNTVVCN